MLQPGTFDGSNTGGGYHVHGARDRAWNFTLDGIDNNDPSAGGSNFSPTRTNPDSLSEFRVVTSNPTADIGRNSGATVLLVSKSGTNEFHGNGFWFYRTPAPERQRMGVELQQSGQAPVRPEHLWRQHRRPDLAQQDVLLRQHSAARAVGNPDGQPPGLHGRRAARDSCATSRAAATGRSARQALRSTRPATSFPDVTIGDLQRRRQ